jgi:hypothetical protein
MNPSATIGTRLMSATCRVKVSRGRACDPQAL